MPDHYRVTYWVELTILNHETAEFASDKNMATVALPVPEWIGLGRPGRISFTPEAAATPEGQKDA